MPDQIGVKTKPVTVFVNSSIVCEFSLSSANRLPAR